MRTAMSRALLAGWAALWVAGCAGGKPDAGTGVAAEPLAAAAPVQVAELFGDAGPGAYAFGRAVALSGRLLAVAEPGGLESPVFVFRRGDDGRWSREARLTHPEGLRDVSFGLSVALSGSTLVVGAPGDGDGAAWVYRRDRGRWTVEARLGPPAPGPAYFGRAVALDGDTLVVGAPVDGRTGAAYLFERGRRGRWQPQGRLAAADAGVGDFFGGAVAVDQGTVLVGAELHTDLAGGAMAPRRGAAYVFGPSGRGLAQEAELCPADAYAWDHQGYSVALSGSTAVVGNFRTRGAAHVYERRRDGWVETAALGAAENEADAGFGRGVAVSGPRILVGAPWGDKADVESAGEAYLFQRVRGGWTRHLLLDSDDPSGEFESYGWAVAIDGRTGVVAAPMDDEGGVDAGAVYVFRLP